MNNIILENQDKAIPLDFDKHQIKIWIDFVNKESSLYYLLVSSFIKFYNVFVKWNFIKI